MLKLAMLSSWHVHAKGYAKEFMELDDCVITAVWDENKEAGRVWAKELQAVFYEDLDELLKSDDVDSVAVCTPTTMHKDVIIKAANAKKHIFTEKVLATTTSDAVKIKQAIDDAGVKFCISYPKRSIASIQFAKKAINENLLGDITYLRVRNAHSGTSDGWLPDTFYDKSQCGGGAMMDLGAHPMYLLAYLLGEPKYITSIYNEYFDKGVDDNAVSIIEFENKIIGVSETSFVSALCPFELEICGTGGTLKIEEDTVRYINKESNNKWITPALDDNRKNPIKQFVEGVLYDKNIDFTIDDAIVLTRLMEAGYSSNITGKKVKV